MAVNIPVFQSLLAELKAHQVNLVAVSKLKSVSEIRQLYAAGQLDFGENYVQELVEKAPQLPTAIRWHFIGHLQSNKVKYIAPFVHLIHGVDSPRLLQEINKQAKKAGRVIEVLLQVYIAKEETKFGLDETELFALLHQYNAQPPDQVRIAGLMGMASFSNDPQVQLQEFRQLRNYFDRAVAENLFSRIDPTAAPVLSMGMSGDYRVAIEAGSNLVRIGSLLFGVR